MLRIMAIAAASLALPATAAEDAAVEATTIADAVAEFKTLCADTLGEPAAFAAKRDASAWAYRARRETPAMRAQPGDSWESAKGILFYANADWLPMDLPSPQCRLAVAASAVSLPTVFDDIGTALGLGAPKLTGSAPQMRAVWVVGKKGEVRSQFSATVELMGDKPADLTLNLSRLRK